MTIEGILGRKLGATQVFDGKGRLRGVTAVEVGPCFVTDIRTPEKNGYAAVQVGFSEDKRLNKPETGHLKAAGNLKLRHLAEFASDGGDYALGDRIGTELFETGQKVDVTSTSKGAASRVACGGITSAVARRRTVRATGTALRVRSVRGRLRAGCTRARAWPATWGPSA